MGGAVVSWTAVRFACYCNVCLCVILNLFEKEMLHLKDQSEKTKEKIQIGRRTETIETWSTEGARLPQADDGLLRRGWAEPSRCFIVWTKTAAGDTSSTLKGSAWKIKQHLMIKEGKKKCTANNVNLPIQMLNFLYNEHKKALTSQQNTQSQGQRQTEFEAARLLQLI